MKKNLCIIYNFAQLYREPIFRLIDEEWECDWYFGRNTTDIKSMPSNALKHIDYVNNQHLLGPMEWQYGIGRLMRDERYETYLMLGEPMVLSTWWILLQRRLFYHKKRVYLWTHGWYGREGFVKKWLKRVFFGLADHIFSYGEYARQEAIKQGFDGSRITPIHNSLNHNAQIKLRESLRTTDLYSKHFENNYLTILFIGRLTHSKRLDQLLDAIYILRSRGEPYNLVLIGSGEAHSELELQTNRLGLNKHVWFYGACYDDNQNAALIYNSDLCVSPGNVGLTAVHTMVFGTPVLTHDDFPWQGPEFEAIRPGETGAFFRRGDVNALADGISDWFATHPDREAVRRACYHEIDTRWTPEYQLSILKRHI